VDAVDYTHLAYLNDRSSTFNIDDPATFGSNQINPLTIHYAAHNRSAYIQDSWAAMPSVTINAGVRFERQILENGNGENTLDVDNLSPRLGIVWDVSRNGRSKVYGYFGRFFESLS